EDAMPARGGDRELGAGPRVALEERVLVADDVAHDLERPGDEGPRRLRPHLSPPAVRLLPQRPPTRIRGEELEAGQGRARRALLPEGEGAAPRLPPQLAVSDHVEPGGLRERDRLADRAILGVAQRLGSDPPLARALPGLAEVGRAQEAPDHVGTRD